MAHVETATKLLDSAQRMVQLRGFNAFSYADLAAEVGIRSASIHYHFKSKMDLGEALLDRYVEALGARLAELELELSSPKERLQQLIDDYRHTEQRGFMCLCGSLASDFETLPQPMQQLIDKYLARTEDWVCEQIQAGAAAGELTPIGDPQDLASMLISGLQGALLIGRARGSSHGGSVLDRAQRAFWVALGV